MNDLHERTFESEVYDDARRWRKWFGAVAAHLAADFAPDSVLDAGCGRGYLVEALRDLGIEAWGVDVSERALSHARSDIRPYCAAGSIAGPLPQGLPARFDLVVCIETLQFLHEEDAPAAVARLCSAADAVLFVSSPDDMDYREHRNSRQPEYWAKLFAQNGFLPDLGYLPSYIAPHARLFQKRDLDARAIEDYEHERRLMKKSLDQFRGRAEALQNELGPLAARAASLQNEVALLRGSTCWRLTWPLRKSLDIVKSAGKNAAKTIVYCRRNGLKMTAARIRGKLGGAAGQPRSAYDEQAAYDAWIARYDRLTVEKRLKIENEIAAWKERPLISVLMPTYNSRLDLLREAVDSVRDQLYPNWQLCIADDASTSEELKNYLRRLQSDPRVKVTFRPANGHICAASNSALELCGGVFTVLMDHDDTISPLALYEVVRVLRRRPNANVIYSDEDKIDAEGKRSGPFFKGDWDPYRILSQNYVSHLGAYRTSLIKELGGFRVGYEGSQDHDLVLRCALRSNDAQIVHIPRVLYHWRHFPGTGSFSDSFLRQCERVRRQCVRDYLAAKGLKADVSEGFSGYNRVVFTLPEPLPRVSVIIPAKDHADLTRACIEGVLKADHPNLEVILVDNGSTEKDALRLCERLEREGRVRVIRWDRPFNYAEINNMAACEATGEYLLFLNNDIKPVAPDWIKFMLGYAALPNAGCVGAKLLYPNDTIQHAGVVLGLGVASHVHRLEPYDTRGNFGAAQLPHVVSAVTGACLMVKKELFFAVGGLEEKLAVNYNDIDLCLKVMERGCHNVVVPYAVLYHFESVSRGSGYKDEATRQRFEREQAFMRQKWARLIANDPYYNPNLTRRSNHYEVISPEEERGEGDEYECLQRQRDGNVKQ